MKKIYIFLFVSLFSLQCWGGISSKVTLDVPLVAQGRQMCGPATLQMLFQYWGEQDYNQYDIAESILKQFSGSKRYINSGILSANPIDWSKYPGTGTINMREFLKRFGSVNNIMMENEPVLSNQPEQLFRKVKESVSLGAPVIVHQYWSGVGSNGHYRIVTGYDDEKRIVYLNDANGGRKITQSYDEFLTKWNVNERWMHYNAIIFYPHHKPLNVSL